MTSAPWSANVAMAAGPDKTDVRSMTRTPVKGPLFSESMSSLFLKLGQARTRDVHVYSQYLTVASRFGVLA